MNKYLQSNTVRLGTAAILGAAIAYLSGQVDAAGAGVLALTGILQILQRSVKLSREDKPASGPDAGGPGVTGS